MSEVAERSDLTRSDDVVVREAVVADCQEIADIYNESVVTHDITMDLALHKAENFQSLMESFSDRETILVLEEKATVIGWGIIKQYSSRLGYRVACETSVYLRRGLSGQGLGSVLKKAVIERCRQYGYHHLVARIRSGNEISIKYNMKFGYEVVGTQKQIGYSNGRWHDVVILQLILDDVPPYEPDRG